MIVDLSLCLLYEKYFFRIECMFAGTYYIVSTFTFVSLRDTREGRTRKNLPYKSNKALKG